jgi:hypothetical protein
MRKLAALSSQGTLRSPMHNYGDGITMDSFLELLWTITGASIGGVCAATLYLVLAGGQISDRFPIELQLADLPFPSFRFFAR